ncbi:MAG: hemerythrin domain-containing protein [Thermoprotei archaeon]
MFLDALKRDHEETLNKIPQFEGALLAFQSGNFLGIQAMVNYLADEVVDKHFAAEERAFFPVFEPVLKRYLPNEEPIRMLKLEHMAISKAVEEVRTYASQADVQKVVSRGEYLISALKQHIFREENGVFPMAEKYMSDEEKECVQKKIDELKKGK